MATHVQNKISRGSNVVLNALFILIVIVCLFPILLVLAVSFTDETALLNYGYNIIPKVSACTPTAML